MHFPTPQGVNSSTFRPPPVDGSLTLLEIFDYHALHSGHHPIFRYEDASRDVHNISWGEAAQAFHTAARFVQRHATDHKPCPFPVVAILAVADSITYFSLIVGIMRAGFLPFPISTRNSAASVKHLLETTESKNVFVSKDQAMQQLANAACRHEGAPQDKINILPMPTFNDIFVTNSDFEPLPPLGTVDQDRPAVIMHSSGSAAFPKAITLTHRMMLECGLQPYYGECDLCGHILSVHALPMFHLMGVKLISLTAVAGLTIAVFPPRDEPVLPTSDNVLSGAIATGCTLVTCAPAFLEAWARDQSNMQALKKFHTVIFGGGPLQERVGDMLTDNGVTITPSYGLTETSAISMFIPKRPPTEGWGYFRVSPHVDAVFLPLEDKEDIFRLIVKRCPTHTPAILNMKVDGSDALDTHDLVIRHSTNHHLYKIYGRLDDQIMHSTGEKTNPTPIEAILHKDTKIASAIMFGREKFYAGVLIAPAVEYMFDPKDLIRLAEYRNLIWDTVQQANQFAPQHSRIFKEMILVAQPSKPFEYTAKGTPRRQVVLDSYKKEIDDIYKAVEESSQGDIVPAQMLELSDVRQFVKTAVSNVMGQELKDSDDIFNKGGDSLQATWIRNSILLALRKSRSMSTASIRALPPNFVFDFPSIASLSAFVYGAVFMARACEGNVSNGDSTDDDPEGQVLKWQALSLAGQTVVKLREGEGAPPLIVLHGGSGSIHAFGPLQEQFRSAIWAIQVTPDTPLESLAGLTDFYFGKIKEQRPHGPYRLAGFSASSIIVFALTQLFEKNGDRVIQLALLDHFPSMFLCPVNGLDIENLDFDDPTARQSVRKASVERVCDMLRRDGDGKIPRRHQMANEFWDAFNGLPTSPLSQTYMKTLEKINGLIFGFIVKLAKESVMGRKDGKPSMESLLTWLKMVKAPLTVYVASNGILGGLPQELREEWADLGVGRCFPDAKVHHLDGGHLDILANPALTQSLQEGYLFRDGKY